MKKLLMIIPLVILFYFITGCQQPGFDALEHAQPPDPVRSLPGKIPLVVAETGEPGDFGLVQNGHAADFHVDADDFRVVHIAADCLASDVERVTGIKPRVQGVTEGLSSQAVLIGTIGKSALIDTLMRNGKLDVRAIEGQWESFILATVGQPLPGVDEALVIAGSDRRGTAFGVFTLSESIGVSPWVWWADVPPRHRASLVARRCIVTSGPPSVQYRGIFINDEDWGLQPWSAKTFEPETGDIGPKTYAKVCELLLRLKANYLWPAMHSCTKAFNIYLQNKFVADDYAIVMGSSHCEQMLRNNVTEYDVERLGPWDYEQNRSNIMDYWRQRLEENGRFESIYTIGMRGIHDSGMPGGGSIAEKVFRLQRVITDQRRLIADTINSDPAAVPQIFCPYKEVLILYQTGLKVPEDVALVWPDDNHGYIRQLSSPREQRRNGGAGIYYHISYWGAPEDYLWLCTTPPALIWEEMHKAYAHGARRVWVVNVGDIKPAEIDLEFFLRLAWDIEPWNETAQPVFLSDWAARTFGSAHAAAIAGVLDEYYRLNYPAKPEHLHLAHFTSNYDETDRRLQRFAELVKRANALLNMLPSEQRDAFYELVVYPVRGSALINQMHLSASAEEAAKAYDRIQKETEYYNELVASGKWRHMMSSNPRNRPALRKPAPDEIIRPESGTEDAGAAGGDGYLCFEAEKPSRSVGGGGTAWKLIQGLGRSGDSIALLPTTVEVPSVAVLEYDFDLAQAVDATVQVYCIPTHPITPEMQLRCSVGIDSGESRIIDLASAEFSRQWSANVLRAAMIGSTGKMPVMAGKHILKLRPLNPGVVFDKVVIDLGELKPTHLGPPATRATP